MTQQNAALVEESAAAAHSLEEQSRELNRLMGFFQVGAQAPQAVTAGHTRAKAPPPPASRKPAPAKVAKPAAKPAKAHAGDDWAEF
jgi:methyl-accepting chemotaxis protein